MSNHLGDTNKMVGEDHIRDATKMVSDTPRTDAKRGFHDLDTAVDAEFSEQLERELNEANDRIKRLESVENSHADVLKAIDNWMKQQEAKEAKL